MNWTWFWLCFAATFVVVAGPELFGLLLDELYWSSLRRRHRRQARDAKPFAGNACQTFKTPVALGVALFLCGTAQAAEIPPFTLTVPSVERMICDGDTTIGQIDFDPVTINVMARGSWSTLVKTFYNVPRDSALRVALTTYPGAGGTYLVQWRCSEPPKGASPGVIGCWLPRTPAIMIATGW